VTAAAALQLGCPGAQVRPEPADCPAEARDAMFNLERKDGLRMWPGDSFMLTLAGILRNRPALTHNALA